MKPFLKEGNDANVTNITDYFRFLELAKNFWIKGVERVDEAIRRW